MDQMVLKWIKVGKIEKDLCSVETVTFDLLFQHIYKYNHYIARESEDEAAVLPHICAFHLIHWTCI